MKPILVITFCILYVIPGLFAQSEFSSKTIHMGVVVNEMETSLKFYKEIIGMIQTDRTYIDINEGFAQKSGLSNGIPFRIEILKLGSGKEATEFKLMSFPGKSKSQQSEYIYNNTGIQYITIMVENLAPFIERIEDAGIPFLGQTPVELSNHNYFVLIKSPDDTFIELIGPWEK